MIKTILGWLGSGTVTALGEQLNAAYARRLDAQTDAAKLEADTEIAYLQGKRDILLREQDSWLTRSVRPAYAYPPAIYFGKIYIWDKTLGLGTTDPLSPELYNLAMIIVGSYFVTRGFEKLITRTKR